MNDPAIQGLILEIENQRNSALTRSAQMAGQIAKLKADYDVATKEIAALKARLDPPRDTEGE